MEIVKFVSVGIICAIICLVIKQTRPEVAPFVEIAAIILIAAMLIDSLKSVFSAAEELIGNIGIINDGYIFLLVKVLGVAIVTKIGADVCRDCGNSALATNVELAGKVTILVMCFSLIKTIAELAVGLLS